MRPRLAQTLVVELGEAAVGLRSLLLEHLLIKILLILRKSHVSHHIRNLMTVHAATSIGLLLQHLAQALLLLSGAPALQLAVALRLRQA